MKTANDYQVSGVHYNMSYQCWDWIHDISLPYHLACAAKYLVRWRTKNGVVDLEKSHHFLQKSIELDIKPAPQSLGHTVKTHQFVTQLYEPEGDAIMLITMGDLRGAMHLIDELVASSVRED